MGVCRSKEVHERMKAFMRRQRHFWKSAGRTMSVEGGGGQRYSETVRTFRKGWASVCVGVWKEQWVCVEEDKSIHARTRMFRRRRLCGGARRGCVRAKRTR